MTLYNIYQLAFVTIVALKSEHIAKVEIE